MTRPLVIVWVCLLLAGCSDPLRDILNSKWLPVSSEQQRRDVIATSAQALSKLTAPNIALGVKLADAQAASALLSDELKKQGVQGIELEGDKQLLHLRVRFSRQFTEADAVDDGNLRTLLAAVRPEIAGSIDLYAGLAGALATSGPTPELTLRVAPGLSAVAVDKIKLAGKVDATKAGELLASLLNRYKENVSGALSRASFTRLVVPALSPQTFDINKSFRVADGTVKFDVKANPIGLPFKLDGVAWLVTEKELTALVQVGPVDPPAAEAAASAVAPTFDAVRERVEGLVKYAFDVPDADSSTWVAIRKDLLAAAVNNAVGQSGVCVTAVADANLSGGGKIPMPKADDINCHQTKPCDMAPCPFRLELDRRGCGRFDVGCRFFQGAENDRRRVAANLAVAQCQADEQVKKGICEAGKESARIGCEAAKALLPALGPNIGDVQVDARVRTRGVQACLRDFMLTPALDRVEFSLDVQGKGQIDLDVKYRPLDAGHLLCFFPWKEAKTFEASLRESRLGISSALQFVTTDAAARVDFATETIPVKARLSPSPVEFLLASSEMSLACPLVAGAKPVAVLLTPLVKELRGELDFPMPSQKLSVDLALPSQTVGDAVVDARVVATKPALVVAGELGSKK